MTLPDAGLWAEALCVGRINEYMTKNLEGTPREIHTQARMLCEGCPMMMSCGDYALTSNVTGMVCMGEPIPETAGDGSSGSGVRRSRERIRAKLDGKHVTLARIANKRPDRPGGVREAKRKLATSPDEMQCLRCHCRTRPRHSSLSEHPDTLMEQGRGLCQSCYKNATYTGEIDNYPRKVRKDSRKLKSVSI